MPETVQCTLCAKEESPGFYSGCMVKDGHAPEWSCDGNGNLTKKGKAMSEQVVIEIDIEGGMVQGVKAPEGVTIKVNDYDIEGIERNLKTDINGHEFVEQIFEGNGEWQE